MADRTSAARLHIAAPPPFHISKDFQGPDNPIPLSPQWLLPKPGETKPGAGTVENHVISTPLSNISETVKTSGNGEDAHDGYKRKDVFRPSMLASESERRVRWRDEERDTKSSTRKDRWRDGDKDLGDARRVDRWTENPSSKNVGETRRGTPDRWNDSGNRETNFDQRRESKWNTRWGPDGKEPEVLREKWSDVSKNGDQQLDKGLTHLSNPGKDEKEGDHYLPWRPNSSQSRGRVEPSPYPNVTPNKQVPTFSSGRGRREDTPPVNNLGRARLGSGGSPINSTYMHSQYTGTVLDKFESEPGESPPFRYSRTDILGVYRVTDVHTNRKLVNDFVQVPSLTQDGALEPLALFAPTSEELSVLKGIDKGEIISSSAPQVPKDGRNSTKNLPARQIKFGNAPLQDRGEEGGSDRVADEVPSNQEPTFEEHNSDHPGTAWRATQMGEHASSRMHDSRDGPSDVRPRNSDMSWSHQPKDPRTHWENNLDHFSDTRDVAKWQSSESSAIKRQQTGVFDGEHETRRVSQISPEDLSLFYKDPQGRVQGPFKGIDIIGWFEAEYFGIDLPVRMESAAADSPWSQLGDVMPHLRAKAHPPPGFSVSEHDTAEAPVRQNSSTFGSIHSGVNEVDILRNDSMHRPSSGTEAENRFLESLMSGSKSSSPQFQSLTFSEGLQGFIGNNSGSLGPPGADVGNSPYLLAKRMAVERQRSFPNPYSYWPGIDAASLAPMVDIVPDASPHSKLMSSLSDNSRQNSELISVIQGLSERAPTGLNNGVAGWPNYPLQGGLNPFQNKIDLHRDPNFMPFGIQQQRLQSPNQMSLNNLVAQNVDNPSSMLAAEKLLSQDPQLVNMLQQQYLLQLHSQASAPTQQMPLLDKLLLLKQQQQHEEQQLLLRQQQQLLSQVLQGNQSHQRFNDISYAQWQAGGIPMGNLHVDPSQLPPPQEIFPTSSQTLVPGVHDELSMKSLNLPMQVSRDTSYNMGSESSGELPHRLFGNISHQNTWDSTLHVDFNEQHQKETLPASASVESSLLNEQNRAKEELDIAQKPLPISDCTAISVEQMPDSTCRTNGTLVSTSFESGEHFEPVHSVEPFVAVSLAGSLEIELPLAGQLGKGVEIKPDSVEEKQVGRDSSNFEPFVADVRNVEAREPKKATEKKSKKQKSSKSQSSSQAKGLLKNETLQQSKISEAEKPDYSEINSKEVTGEAAYETYLKQTSGKESLFATAIIEGIDHQEVRVLCDNNPGSISETVVENDSKSFSSVATQNNELAAGRAWKPAPGFRAKSLLEIQQEEQKRAHTEMPVSEVATSVNSLNLTTPWVGVVSNPDSTKLSSESHRDAGNTEHLTNSELPAGRAWMPAPGFRAKSLLEIQQEEQKRAHTEMLVSEVATSVNSLNLTTPWVGVVSNPDSTKPSSESHRDAGNTEHLTKTKTSQNSKSKKSQLHDLLSEDVKSYSERDGQVPDSISTSQYIAAYSEPTDEGAFIEAKDTKRSRKKSSKSKVLGSKVSLPVASSEAPISSSPIERGKISRSVQQEKEQLPTIPSGPSLGDFVLWREETTSPSPPLAWTMDSGKVPKPTSLRDILKEQEKKSSSAVSLNQLPTPKKSQPAQAAQSSGISRTMSASSPSKAASSSQINFQACQSKHKGGDDLFWGPIEQSKPESKQSGFPQLASQGSWGSKNVPIKSNSPGPLSRQKSGSSKATERLLSSSPASSQSLQKLRKDAMTKNSEANDFRVWCESECVRLIGTQDTSFLEFCSKQSRSEAEMFLIENLGSYDPDHEFIDKFLNYMDLLPAEVLDMAFQMQNDRKVTGGLISGNTDLQDLGHTEGFSSKGGRKGKKGKKVSASVLGFNVVSNRIMMGEIQTAED